VPQFEIWVVSQFEFLDLSPSATAVGVAQFDRDAFGSSKFDDRCLTLATTLLVQLDASG
jgi:hypothetical protein